jgi:hypothetical protein
MLALLTLQGALPALLLLWLAFRRPTGRLSWLAGALFVLGMVAAVSLAVPWLFLPSRVRYFYLLAWVVAVWRSGRRVHPVDADKPPGRGPSTRAMAGFAISVAAWITAGLAVDGRRMPLGDVLDLACPLGPGTYLVINGGSRLLVNAHLAPFGAEVARGLRYGVDLVQVDGLGRRASELASLNLSDYRIYGAPVFAPCGGHVVSMADSRPDRTPPHGDPDRAQPLGNHIVLQCGQHEVVLAHLQPGSVRVAPGEAVSVSDLLGFVGNSGDTREPHLHVSVQRRSQGQPPIGGEPAWLTINRVFPVRNDRVVCE